MSPRSTQRAQRLKRLLPSVLVCLLLGLALNFGIAYACARWSPVTSHGVNVNRMEIYSSLMGRGLGIREYAIFESSGDTWVANFGCPSRSLSLQRLKPAPPPGHFIFGESFLLPWDNPDNTPILQQAFYQTGDRTWSILPLGTVINTFFYAAILLALWIAPGVLIRWNRARRGLCPRCAYDIVGVTICPECGTPVPSPVQPAS